MKIDHEVEALRAQAACELQIVTPPREAARTFDDDDVVEIGMVTDDRLGRGFDQIADGCARKPSPQRPDRGRGEHHVANQAEADKKDA